MSLATNISDAFVRVATECKSLRTLINGNAADLSALNTAAKSNLVAAINELHSAVAGSSGIDDNQISSVTTYSSAKIEAEIDALINDASNATDVTWSASKIGATVAGLILDTADSTDAAHTFSAKHIAELLTSLINDAGTSTGSAWSSSKTSAAIASLLQDGTTGSVTTWSSTKITDYVATALGASSSINDSTTTLTTVWSSQKVSDSIAEAVSALVDGAPTALNTLKELADALAADEGSLGTILTALDKRVRVDSAQAFTDPEKAQARVNIGAASQTDVDSKVDYTAAQTLTGAQQLQARTNIGAVASADVGATDTDYLGIFVASLT